MVMILIKGMSNECEKCKTPMEQVDELGWWICIKCRQQLKINAWEYGNKQLHKLLVELMK